MIEESRIAYGEARAVIGNVPVAAARPGGLQR